MRKTIKTLALATVAVCGLGLTPAGATYSAGDLMLYFQNPGGATGGSQTLLYNLGLATNWRDQATNSLNFANIGTELTSTFGASWWEATTLYMGLAGVRSSSAASTVVTVGDPTRTLYVGQSRNATGTPGSANSAGYILLSAADTTTAAGNMINQNNNHTTVGGVHTEATGTSEIDNQNPFLGANQGTAFGVFPGGVQFQFGANAWGTLAGVNAEGALDLYRILARTDLSGITDPGTALQGQYQGSFLISQSGDLSFVVVPEPSAAALLGAAGLLGFVRRRRSA